MLDSLTVSADLLFFAGTLALYFADSSGPDPDLDNPLQKIAYISMHHLLHCRCARALKQYECTCPTHVVICNSQRACVACLHIHHLEKQEASSPQSLPCIRPAPALHGKEPGRSNTCCASAGHRPAGLSIPVQARLEHEAATCLLQFASISQGFASVAIFCKHCVIRHVISMLLQHPGFLVFHSAKINRSTVGWQLALCTTQRD